MSDLKNSNTASEELRSFVERIESLHAEKAGIAHAEKEVFAEAKGRGYEVKIIRKLIAERKRNADDVAEEDALMEMYREALGMAYSLTNTASDEDTASMV